MAERGVEDADEEVAGSGGRNRDFFDGDFVGLGLNRLVFGWWY